MLKRFFLKSVWVLVFLVAMPVAMVVGVARGSRAAVDVLGWPDDVCNRLKNLSLLNALLTVLSMAITTLAANLIWFTWRTEHGIFSTPGAKFGFTAAGVFIYLAGWALFLVVIRKKSPSRSWKLILFPE